MSEKEQRSKPGVHKVQPSPPSYTQSQSQNPQYPSAAGHHDNYAYKGADGQQQSTVVITQPYPAQGVVYTNEKPPGNYMGLAVFACLCCCWPVGICAIVAASNAKSSAAVGDLEAARRSSNSARNLSIASIIFGVIWITTSIVLRVLYYSNSQSY